MDYASLRQEGIRLLERMTGGQWTDFNTHDPGITLLEQLCYALTDLGYRAKYALPDLLADGGGEPYSSLHPPAAILTSGPVTLDDLRRLVLDVDGVKNAWVEPIQPGDTDALPIYYLPAKNELRLTTTELAAQRLNLRGIYRVLIEASGFIDDTTVRSSVATRLHKNRALCEDFAQISVLKTQPIQVDATVEVSPVDDPSGLVARICQALAAEISPTVPFATLAQLIDAGVPVDEIFDGPRLTHGFLTAETLENASRRVAVHTSDLMRAIMSVPGVRAVSRIRISKGGSWEEWSQSIDSDKAPRLDLGGSRITLRRAGKVIDAKLPTTLDVADTAVAIGSTPIPRCDAGTLTPPVGRNRSAGKYTSIQTHLPMLFGIGETGLPDSVSAERKAQAQQLKAYLLFFDQLLANSFSQLAHVKELFSYSAAAQTYFTQAVDQPGLGLEDVRVLDDAHRQRLQSLVEQPGSSAALERKNRFLNHLLARFAEPISDHTLATSLKERAEQKQRLLQRYPRCSSARGTGPDSLSLDDHNRSGLVERLRLTIGLDSASGEDLIVVEHILLRPMQEDVIVDAQGRPLELPTPLVAALAQTDPYSLQLTFVLPDGVGRFQRPEFKQLVERTLRDELPAHLSPYVCWLDAATWQTFVAAHKVWLRMRRDYTAENSSVKLTDAGAGNPGGAATQPIDVRAARDRLIDLLGLGQTYPLPDIEVVAERITVDYNRNAALFLAPSQVNVRYELYDGDKPATPASSLIGTGTEARLPGPPIREDHTFKVRAVKVDHPDRQLFLLTKQTVKVGLDQDLPTTMPAVSPDVPIVDYGSKVEVRIDETQPGVSYRLIDAKEVEVSAAPVTGNGATISLFTKPVTEDLVLRIKATREFDAAEGRPALKTILDASLPLAVRANPALGVSIDTSPICEFQGTVKLNLTGSQKSTFYSVYVRTLLDADFVPTAAASTAILTIPVPGAADVKVKNPPRPSTWQVQPSFTLLAQGQGTDGLLQLPLGPLTEDCVVVVQAHKDHSATVATQSDLQLVQAAAILVRPDPVPALKLQLATNPDGQSGNLTVTYGQPGVFYHLRRTAQGSELGLPAYFHKLDDTDPAGALNRGIGLYRLEMDLVVARDQPAADGSTPGAANLATQHALAPVVAIAPLPTDGTLSVLATKARTGVSWSASRQLPVTPA